MGAGRVLLSSVLRVVDQSILLVVDEVLLQPGLHAGERVVCPRHVRLRPPDSLLHDGVGDTPRASAALEDLLQLKQ